MLLDADVHAGIVVDRERRVLGLVTVGRDRRRCCARRRPETASRAERTRRRACRTHAPAEDARP